MTIERIEEEIAGLAHHNNRIYKVSISVDQWETSISLIPFHDSDPEWAIRLPVCSLHAALEQLRDTMNKAPKGGHYLHDIHTGVAFTSGYAKE